MGLNKHSNFSWVNNQGQGYRMKGNPPEMQQQQQKRSSLDDLFVKYIINTETAIQNQQASILNLENQVGQITVTLSNRPQGTLSNVTEKNLREQVLAIKTVENDMNYSPRIKFALCEQKFGTSISCLGHHNQKWCSAVKDQCKKERG